MHALREAAIKKREPLPYMYDKFNIKEFYPRSGTKGLARLLNPFIEAFNEHHRLPKYIIFIPDKDVLANIKDYEFSMAHIIGAVIHHIIKQIDLMIARQRHDLSLKKSGGILPESPKIVWVRMLCRPKSTTPANADFYALRGKLNSIL